MQFPCPKLSKKLSLSFPRFRGREFSEARIFTQRIEHGIDQLRGDPQRRNKFLRERVLANAV